jgi:transcriptional regulator with XRE-family HTH domain
MSKRSDEKRITKGCRALKLLREQAGLSVRGAAKASGVGDSVINHLENGRITLHPRHLEKLLPAYGATQKTFEMFASGSIAMPQNLIAECIEFLRAMSPEQLRTVHPVINSIASHK